MGFKQKRQQTTNASASTPHVHDTKRYASEDDSDVTCALYIIAACGVLLAILLAGMQTGYTPCYLMERYGGSASCHG